MPWFQTDLRLAPRRRGFHLITPEVEAALRGMPEFRVGLLHVFIQHTSASLSINENADPDVPRDLEMAFDAIAPEHLPYVHTCEGPDDMPSHIKSALTQVSIGVPVRSGQMLLGTWQGLYLFEHRTAPHRREVLLHIIGD